MMHCSQLPCANLRKTVKRCRELWRRNTMAKLADGEPGTPFSGRCLCSGNSSGRFFAGLRDFLFDGNCCCSGRS